MVYTFIFSYDSKSYRMDLVSESQWQRCDRCGESFGT